jgi:DNA repair protein RecO (recombination protein O)
VTRARVLLEPSWVLKASPYGDSSLLVEAFSRSHGRVGLVARGARSAKSRPRALLQAFRPLLLSWNESGDLGTLTGVEAHGVAQEYRGEVIFSGWYLNELLMRLLQRHDAHPASFDAYGEALAALPEQGEPALRRFELQLLADLGFGLDLPPDLESDRRYRYHRGEGPVPAAPEDEDGYPGRMLIDLRDDRLRDPADLRLARQLLREALAPHLGGKPLSTAMMLRELRRNAAGSSRTE